MIFRRMDYSRPVRSAVYAFRETFWRKPFFWKARVVWIVSKYERNLIARLLKLPSKCPMERFVGKFLYWKNFLLLMRYSQFRKKFLDILRKKLAGLSKWHSSSPMEHVEEKWFTWKRFEVFIKFGLWTKEIQGRCFKPVF